MNYGRNELIVNFDDACIYGRDLELLKNDTVWLNDAIIHFFFRRLAATADSTSIFLDPSVLSFFMHLCNDEEDLKEFSSGYGNWRGCQRIYCPINDDMGAAGVSVGAGTHWSLLLISLEDQLTCYHFDSVADSGNLKTAQAVAKKWEDSFSKSTGAAKDLLLVPVPQQRNGFDCGCHVLCTARALHSMGELGSIETMRLRLASALDLEENPLLFLDFRREVAKDVLSLATKTS